MTDPVDEQAPLEAVLKDEILRMYQEVPDNPSGSFPTAARRRSCSATRPRGSPEGEMFRLLEESGFTRVRSAVVPRFRFRKESTQSSAEAYGVKAVMMTAVKPLTGP